MAVRSSLVIGLLAVLSLAAFGAEASAQPVKTKVFKDKVGENIPCHRDCDVRKVTVTQTDDRKMRFVVQYAFPSRTRKLTGRTSIHIKVKRKEFRINAYTDGVESKITGMRHTLTFPLSAIRNPRSFRFKVEAIIVDWADYVPSQYKYAKWKVSRDPPKSKGPAVRGPKEVKPVRSVSFRAFWFTSGSPMFVTIQRRSDRGTDKGLNLVLDPAFIAAANGKTKLKFKFPKTFYPEPCVDPASPDCRTKRWKAGSKVDVKICALPPAPAEAECALTSTKIAKKKKRKPSKPNLPVKSFRFRGGVSRATIPCGKARCSGKIEIKQGKVALIKRKHYSGRNGAAKVKLRLTKAGRKALARSKRVRATGIITGHSGKKAKFIAVLKRG